MTVDFDRPEVGTFLTEGQFEACVKQHQVQGGVFGAADLIVSHDDLRVEREPLARTLLHSEQHLSTQTHQANPKVELLQLMGWLTADEPHLIGGCCAGESTQCPPWCPRLTLCSTLPLSDPSRDD